MEHQFEPTGSQPEPPPAAPDPANEPLSRLVIPPPPLSPPAETDAGPPARGCRGRMLWGVLALLVVVAAAFAVGAYFAFDTIRDGLRATSLELPQPTPEPVRNQIAFVGNDFNLWLVSPNGENLRRLTTDGRGYRFPTWSPDGSRLAFIGRNDQNSSALYVSPTAYSQPTIIFNEPDSPPFYLYWSPDSQAVSFLTQEADGLKMRLADVAQPGAVRVLGEGAPFYWAWSPHSDRLVMHVGGSRALSDEAHVSLLDNRRDADRLELELAPGRFQAPAWSADGRNLYYIAEDEQGGESIFKADAVTLAHQPIASLAGFAHMVLSPDNRHVAYLQFGPGSRPPFGQAYLVGADGQEPTELTPSPVASIYWSPDGSKLALLTLTRPNDGPTAAKIDGLAAPLPQEFLMRWWVYHLATAELQPVMTFQPTLNFLQTVPYFDQYHLSLSYWSPDSRYLVVTERLEESDAVGKVWVVDTEGDAAPRKIGDGSLAVWSWR